MNDMRFTDLRVGDIIEGEDTHKISLIDFDEIHTETGMPISKYYFESYMTFVKRNIFKVGDEVVLRRSTKNPKASYSFNTGMKQHQKLETIHHIRRMDKIIFSVESTKANDLCSLTVRTEPRHLHPVPKSMSLVVKAKKKLKKSTEMQFEDLRVGDIVRSKISGDTGRVNTLASPTQIFTNIGGFSKGYFDKNMTFIKRNDFRIGDLVNVKGNKRNPMCIGGWVNEFDIAEECQSVHKIKEVFPQGIVKFDSYKSSGLNDLVCNTRHLIPVPSKVVKPKVVLTRAKLRKPDFDAINLINNEIENLKVKISELEKSKNKLK